jgi:HEAT repeat protein
MKIVQGVPNALAYARFFLHRRTEAQVLHFGNDVAALETGHIGSLEAVRPLAAALDDPDMEVKFYAVVGLGAIAGEPNSVIAFSGSV